MEKSEEKNSRGEGYCTQEVWNSNEDVAQVRWYSGTFENGRREIKNSIYTR